MTKLGKGLWDDPAYFLGHLEPRYPNSYDVGTQVNPIRNLYIGGAINFSADNNSQGVATLAGGTVTVATTNVTTTSKVLLFRQTLGSSPGVLGVGTIVDGVSFDIDSSAGGDDGDVLWVLVN